LYIVELLGRRPARCVLREVVGVDLVRLTPPSSSGILEIPDPFLLFGVHAEEGRAGFRQTLTLLSKVLKWCFAVRRRRSATEPLDLAPQGEVLLAQPPANRVRTCAVPPCTPIIPPLPQASTHPLTLAPRIAAAVRFGPLRQTRLDRVYEQNGGQFLHGRCSGQRLSCCSTPAAARRSLSVGTPTTRAMRSNRRTSAAWYSLGARPSPWYALR